jgi:putative aldouronate transport system substrate-binding protein
VREYTKPFSTTSNVTGWQWVVPNACKAPDKAVQMLNLMFSNADVENTLAWGIEGKHYEKKADGTIGFPAGITQQNSAYYTGNPWMFGNEFNAFVWEGNPLDIWEQTKQFNQKSQKSKAMGFIYDPTPVKTEIAALTNVYTQYKRGLESGSVDPNTVLPQFQAKLKASGIDKVVAEKQKQFDTWAKANNVQ